MCKKREEGTEKFKKYIYIMAKGTGEVKKKEGGMESEKKGRELISSIFF